jgi:glycosyltransferase involved in cell wall biosynthesis
MRIFVPSAATLLTDHRGHGEGLIAWNLLSRLASRGHDVVACARHADLRVAPPFQLIETGPASRWESLEPIAYARGVAGVYRSLGGAGRFDLAHWLFPQGPYEVLGASEGVPFIVGPHALTWPTSPQRRRIGDVVRSGATPLFNMLHRRALGRASSLLVATPDAAAVFPSEFRSKVRVLPFGIDDSIFTPTAELPLDPVIAFVGRLEPKKGVLGLVDAFARVRYHHPDAVLVLAGDGPARALVEERCANYRLNGSVRLLGAVPHDEIPGVLRDSSLVCLPSDGEPYGMAVLEAMASARAVLTFARGGPRFLLSHDSGDQFVTTAGPAGLARSLTSLLSDRAKLTELGRANRRRVERDFSLDRAVDTLEALYAAALGRGPTQWGGVAR